jgi:hypothetical protein
VVLCPAFLVQLQGSPPGYRDPADAWLDLLDLLSRNAVAAARIRQELHVDSIDPVNGPRFRMPWLLDPSCFLSACPRSGCTTMCSFLARYVLLIVASVADAAVHAGECVFAAGRSPAGVRRGP